MKSITDNHRAASAPCRGIERSPKFWLKIKPSVRQEKGEGPRPVHWEKRFRVSCWRWHKRKQRKPVASYGARTRSPRSSGSEGGLWPRSTTSKRTRTQISRTGSPLGKQFYDLGGAERPKGEKERFDARVSLEPLGPRACVLGAPEKERRRNGEGGEESEGGVGSEGARGGTEEKWSGETSEFNKKKNPKRFLAS